MLVIAHRGASAYFAENTLPAIKEAYSSGADFVEVDVRATKDKKLVLFHDKTLNRITNFKGNISDYNLSELSSCRVLGKEKITMLEEAFNFLSSNREMKLKIDVKEPGFEYEIYSLAEKYDLIERLIITSECITTLKKFRSIDTNLLLALGGLTERTLVEKIIRRALKYRLNILSPYWKVITKRFVRLAHQYGLAVDVWTVNDIKHALEFLKMGCDAITTDKPDLIKSAIEKARIFNNFSKRNPYARFT